MFASEPRFERAFIDQSAPESGSESGSVRKRASDRQMISGSICDRKLDSAP